jgi:hypothetical protein
LYKSTIQALCQALLVVFVQLYDVVLAMITKGERCKQPGEEGYGGGRKHDGEAGDPPAGAGAEKGILYRCRICRRASSQQ